MSKSRVASGLFFALTVSLASAASISCLSANPAVRPTGPTEHATLAWGEPLVIRWNQQIADLNFRVSPAAPAHSVIAEDGRAAYIYLEPDAEARQYQVMITDAVGTSGNRLLEPAIFRVDLASRPQLALESEPLRFTPDDWLRLKWDQPMQSISYSVDGEPGEWQLDAQDPSTVWLNPVSLPQGQRTLLLIEEAVSRSGAPLVGSVNVNVQTAPELDLELDSGAYIDRVPVNGELTFTFSSPVRSGSPPEQWLAFEPAVAGGFEWLDEQRLRFIPDEMPEDELIHVALKGGLEGPRSLAGGYLEPEGTAFQFVTAPNKTIDVSLSRQTMTLYEGDQEVRQLPVATGVRGADTPVGEFRVQYKLPVTRFRGINTVSRTPYDIPDVHWVLAFSGDYTIHGAYWRSVFGAPGSNGCVSLSDPNAKLVYDWAPPGTLIRIH